MAIPAVNLAYSGAAPAFTGQILAQAGWAGDAARVLFGSGTATLDGALTSFSVNFIDGTQVLPFTPSAVIVSVTGGTQPAAAVVSAIADAITTTGFTCRLSAAGTNANTLKIGVAIIK